MILNDKQIIKLAEEHEMISPFVNKSVANGISHGVNPFGYDLRCGSEFKIFTNIKGATADPKNFSEDNFITVKDKEVINSAKSKSAIKKAFKLMKGKGRILVRKSGTEPKIRIMCESIDKKLMTKCINLVKRSIN